MVFQTLLVLWFLLTIKSSFIVLVASACRSSIFLWRRYNTLCISGFVDDVIVSYNRLYGCSVYGLTPLLCGVRRGAARLDEPLVQGAPGQKECSEAVFTVAW